MNAEAVPGGEDVGDAATMADAVITLVT